MEDSTHSRKAIKLDELSKEMGYVVPNNYFDKTASISPVKNVWESVSNENFHVVPANYFDTLPQIIQQRIATKRAFDWSKVWKEGFWAVPNGYFEGLPIRIAERLQRKERPSIDWKLILSLLSPRYLLPLAIGCFMIGYVLVQVFNSKSVAVEPVANISKDVIVDYLVEDQLINEDQIIDKIKTSQIRDLASIVPNGLSKEELEKDLDLSNIDESTI